MTAERAEYGVLTDESFERSRRRIGRTRRARAIHGRCRRWGYRVPRPSAKRSTSVTEACASALGCMSMK